MSIQHSSTPSPSAGAPPGVGASRLLLTAAPCSNSSCVKDNSFPVDAFYLSETTPLSLHFGELRLPNFFAMVISCRLSFRRRRICPLKESQNPHPVSQNTRDEDGAPSKIEAK